MMACLIGKFSFRIPHSAFRIPHAAYQGRYHIPHSAFRIAIAAVPFVRTVGMVRTLKNGWKK